MKKSFYLLAATLVLSCSLLAEPNSQNGSEAQAVQAGVAAGTDTGKTRLTAILETGLVAYRKKQGYEAVVQNLAQDLNLEEIATFFGCKTAIGHEFLVQTFAAPYAPEGRALVADRQAIIRALIEDSVLKKEVEELLERAKVAEQEVMTLFSDNFIGRTCPELVQPQSAKKQKPKSTIARIFTVALRTAVLGYACYELKNFIPMTYRLLRYSAEKRAALPYYNGILGTTIGFSSFLGVIAGFNSYALVTNYAQAYEKRVKLHALSELIDIAERFEALMQERGMLMCRALSSVANPQATSLINRLKASRYQAKESYLFAAPLVHSFLYTVYQQEKQLGGLFACVAEMDAYNAIATKMIESRSQSNKLCFVEFLDQEKPHVAMAGFWNVLVPNAVPNTLGESRNVILTGPNAGGKTTAIRSILQNIVLGQSYGIAAAERCAYTAFDVIHSYLHISDDLLQGRSLFASEVKRAQDIIQVIKALQPQQKFFFALDELFTGTAAEAGESCAYEFVKRLAGSDRIQFIYATHFQKLKELEGPEASCANYKVDAPIKNGAGKLVYPFTLSKGANEVNVALDIAREADLFA